MSNSFKYVFTETPTNWSMNACHNSLSFSSDGTILAGTMAMGSSGYPDGNLQFWQTTTGAVTTTLNNWSYIVFSPTDPDMAVGIGSPGLGAIKRASGSQTWSLSTSFNASFRPPFMAVFRPNGSQIAVSYSDALVREVELSGFMNSRGVTLPTSKTFAVAYCPTDPDLAVVGREDGEVIIVSYNSSSVRSKLSPVGSTEISATAWSPDGKWIATGDKAGDVRLWSVSSATSISLSKQLLRVQSGTVNNLIFLQDNTGLLISCGGQLSVWDIAGGEYVANSGLPPAGKNIALDGPRNRIAVATDNKITLYEIKIKPDVPQPQRQGRRRGKHANVTPSLPSELVAIDITTAVVKTQPKPFEGLYFDIYRGVYTKGNLQHAVAIKVVRSGFGPDSTAEERKDFQDLLMKCLTTWSTLSNDNIIPLFGVSTEYDTFPGIITSWMTNGLLSIYLESKADYDPLELTIGVASGVAYLHSNGIVHGDIRASSILVDEFGKVRLADPGLLPVFVKSPLVANGTLNLPYRWMAPELLKDTSVAATTATDVYSVTMTSLEIFTEAAPFKGVSNSMVTNKIIQGERPDRPVEVEDELWTLWGEGWNQDASKRPDMASYVLRLNRLD